MAKTSELPVALSSNNNDFFCIEDSGGTKKIRKDNLFSSASNVVASLNGAASVVSLDGSTEAQVDLSGFSNSSGLANAVTGEISLSAGTYKLTTSVRMESQGAFSYVHWGFYDGTVFSELFVKLMEPSTVEQDYTEFVDVIVVTTPIVLTIRVFKDNNSVSMSSYNITNSLIVLEKLA